MLPHGPRAIERPVQAAGAHGPALQGLRISISIHRCVMYIFSASVPYLSHQVGVEQPQNVIVRIKQVDIHKNAHSSF